MAGLFFLALATPAGRVQATGPRSVVFTSAHDFLAHADLSGGAVVTWPGSDRETVPADRVNGADASVRLPTLAHDANLPNLVPPAVTVDTSYPGYTPAPIYDQRSFGGVEYPGEVWASGEHSRQHWVDWTFIEGPRAVDLVTVRWGLWRPRRWKLQIANASGWLEDATPWRDATSEAVSMVSLGGGPTTTRVRVVQDAGGGPASRPNLMSMEELEVRRGEVLVERPVVVDSTYSGYSDAAANDGDRREGLGAELHAEVWVSANSSAQHYVRVRLPQPTTIGQARIYWGRWGSARFKLQYWDWNGLTWRDTSSSVGQWLAGDGVQGVSVVSFDPVVTEYVRILQDSNGGAPPPGDARVGLMSVAEVELYSTGNASLVRVDSSYAGYRRHAVGDGWTCADTSCVYPDRVGGTPGHPYGELWVSAETPVDHWVEVWLGHSRFIGEVTLHWGAWGSNSFRLERRAGASWIGSSSSSSSWGVVTLPMNQTTRAIRVSQGAGLGSGAPGEPGRIDLMSLAEISLGYRTTADYVSPPVRANDPPREITLAPTHQVPADTSIAYSVSTDDGQSWTPVTPGVPMTPPAGTRLRWRAALTGNGAATPEIRQVVLSFSGDPAELGAALWKRACRGAVTIGVDDSNPTWGEPGGTLDQLGVRGSYFVLGDPLAGCPGNMPEGCASPYAYQGFADRGHEVADHTALHQCELATPDELLSEFVAKESQLDALHSSPGRTQSMAWPCGNYDLGKGSVAARLFASARGYHDGDPTVYPNCGLVDFGYCALRDGELQDLLEEPTPRNRMNLKAIAHRYDFGVIPNVADAVGWAANEGNWLNLVYHWGPLQPWEYDGELEAAADPASDLWVAPQGEIVRYIRLRDSLVAPILLSTASLLEADVSTWLTEWDVPELDPVRAYPDSVERFFFGSVTLKLDATDRMPASLTLDGAPVAWERREIEGNPFILFDVALTRTPKRLRATWTSPGPCANGLDDDGDGLVDYPSDPACREGGSPRENAECQDGVDNDGRAGIDFDGGASVNGGDALDVADPQCVGKPWRDTELANSCGLGAELALAIAVLRALRRRQQG